MSTSKEVKGLLLEDLWDLCYRAHSWISFSPEKRATRYIKEYSELLKSDLELLGENQGNYKEKFISKFKDWMGAKSNCASSVITGGSGFNVRKANRANDREHKKWQDFSLWRDKYFNAVNRVPTKSPEDELEIAENLLEKLTINQLEYREINAEIRKCKITDHYELLKYLGEQGFDKSKFGEIQERGGKLKIPSYVLTNNNATIKRTAIKVKTMQSRIERKNTWEDIKFDGGYVTIEDDRLKIFHDEKPERAVIDEIKKGGYRWSPHWGCWCRKHTGNAIYSLKFLSFINQK